MSEKKWPFIQWFITDWLGDPKVSQCEPATRGIWFDWLCNMHALDRCGQVTGTREILARIGRCTIPQCDAALLDLIKTNAATVQERNGAVTVVNRRMKREYLLRKSVLERVKKHRCNGHNHIPEPEPEEESTRQPSQLRVRGRNGKLTKLTLEKSSLGRLAREIISNKNAWAYDNCKVKPEMFQFAKSLATALAPFIGRISETKVHIAWQEAVTRTHQASVDALVGDPASYVIQCWKEALEKESR